MQCHRNSLRLSCESWGSEARSAAPFLFWRFQIRARTLLCIPQFGLSIGSFFLSGGGAVFGLGFGSGRRACLSAAGGLAGLTAGFGAGLAGDGRGVAGLAGCGCAAGAGVGFGRAAGAVDLAAGAGVGFARAAGATGLGAGFGAGAGARAGAGCGRLGCTAGAGARVAATDRAGITAAIGLPCGMGFASANTAGRPWLAEANC